MDFIKKLIVARVPNYIVFSFHHLLILRFFFVLILCNVRN